jgi:flagellar basal-body rod protein FlgC
MNFFDALHISSSGLSAQRLRMNLVSSNLANVNTTKTEEGGPYKRKDAVFAATPVADTFQNVLSSQFNDKISEVSVVGVIDDPRPSMLKYDPEHPDANEKGYVELSNVNTIEEMVNMISATRSYEANVAAINATKKMALKALDIGR